MIEETTLRNFYYREALEIAQVLIENDAEPTSALKQVATECKITDVEAFVNWGLTRL